MRKAALLLTPGASATREHSALVALDNALHKSVSVERIDLPRTNKQDRLVTAIGDAAAELAKSSRVKPQSVFLGGRSMGGRMCSIAVAEGLSAAGLILISYPLHPPGKPEILRVDHFKNIAVPCLFVSGTRDAFGTPAELKKQLRKIKGDVTMRFIDGADHGMRKGESEMAELVTEWINHQR